MIERIEALRLAGLSDDYERGVNDGIADALAVVREHLDAAPTVRVTKYGYSGEHSVGKVSPEKRGTYRLLKEVNDE